MDNLGGNLLNFAVVCPAEDRWPNTQLANVILVTFGFLSRMHIALLFSEKPATVAAAFDFTAKARAIRRAARITENGTFGFAVIAMSNTKSSKDEMR